MTDPARVDRWLPTALRILRESLYDTLGALRSARVEIARLREQLQAAGAAESSRLHAAAAAREAALRATIEALSSCALARRLDAAENRERQALEEVALLRRRVARLGERLDARRGGAL